MDREKMIRIKQEKVERVKIQVKRLDACWWKGGGIMSGSVPLSEDKGSTLHKLLFVVPT